MLGIAFGTRPEWLKIKPVVAELEKQGVPHKLIFTGQHNTLINELDINPAFASCDGHKDGYRNRLDNIVYSALDWTSDWLNDIDPLMVQGDTASAFACALAAFHRKIPVIHLEAGLRTQDLENPFPEEGYRQMISCITELHLCPTHRARETLVAERKAFQSSVVVVGNTVLDNSRDVKTTLEKKVLVTMHRRENHERMGEWFININAFAREHPDYEFLLPIHPNPEILKHSYLLTHVKIVEPMAHDELVQYLASCEYVITDSGGIQEEACFLRKPTIVCRKETERQEGLGNFSALCVGPEYLSYIHGQLHHLKCEGKCPYGDGYSAEKVVKAIHERL